MASPATIDYRNSCFEIANLSRIHGEPTHPGPLIITAGTTLHMPNTLRDQNKERLRVFREVQGVEQVH